MDSQLESLLSYFVCLVTGLLLLVMLRSYPVWRYIRRVQKLALTLSPPPAEKCVLSHVGIYIADSVSSYEVRPE